MTNDLDGASRTEQRSAEQERDRLFAIVNAKSIARLLIKAGADRESVIRQLAAISTGGTVIVGSDLTAWRLTG